MNADVRKIQGICADLRKRLSEVHLRTFKGMTEPLLLISNAYAGVWLEHVYDSVIYATLEKDAVSLAETTVRLFIDNMTPDGQLPCLIRDSDPSDTDRIAYSHIQECVSFASLCLKVYEMNKDKDFLCECYQAAKKWEAWLRRYRMTTNRGLVEMFVGFDTGHDNSARLHGLKCPGRYKINGENVNASVLPEGEEIAPVLAVDMSCNLYATDISIAKMAEILGESDTAKEYYARAKNMKEKLFENCYDKNDRFFYDVDKNGNKRKYLSSTIFHLFMEGVLDPEEDKALINEIYERHVKNPEEFWTPYPFPSMAVCDESTKEHKSFNCWGYFTQGLIVLRATLWMDKYGFGDDLDYIAGKWLDAWTNSYGSFNMGQELDPISGKPSPSSEWYSSCMLFYIWAAKRLKIID